MLTARRQTAQIPSRSATSLPVVCVVDSCLDDYRAWQTAAKAGELRVQLCVTAEEALRFAQQQSVDLWVINTKLPGLSGFELCQMVRARSTSAAVFLVADDYSVEAEQAAWQARASMFGCKPTHLAWCELWRQRKRETWSQ